ncbi:transmembrane emp24 domain-containing protein p24delta9-like protein, partial [Tanacetum coccineum]
IFESAEHTARAYDEAARLMCGPRARTNFLCNPNMSQSLSSKLLFATLTAGLHICYMMQVDKKEFGTYAFTANEDGNYMACFMVAKQNPPAILTVEFDWRSGLATKDWSKVAKRGQLERGSCAGPRARTNFPYDPNMSQSSLAIFMADVVFLFEAAKHNLNIAYKME